MAELDLLGLDNKQEDNGASARGRLTAAEWNQMIQRINVNTQLALEALNRMGGISLQIVENEDVYESMEKSDNVLYIVLE